MIMEFFNHYFGHHFCLCTNYTDRLFYYLSIVGASERAHIHTAQHKIWLSLNSSRQKHRDTMLKSTLNWANWKNKRETKRANKKKKEDQLGIFHFLPCATLANLFIMNFECDQQNHVNLCMRGGSSSSATDAPPNLHCPCSECTSA